MKDYKTYDDERLVHEYIFSLPESADDKVELVNELERRNLSNWAHKTFLELADIFHTRWAEKRQKILKKIEKERGR